MPYFGYDRGSHADNYYSRIGFTTSVEESKEAPEYGEFIFGASPPLKITGSAALDDKNRASIEAVNLAAISTAPGEEKANA